MEFEPATSTLEAVNTILSTIDEVEVATLDETPSVDVKRALNVLQEISRTVLTRGWDFNTEELELAAGSEPPHEIALPDSILSFRVPDRSIDLIRRGNRLYDRKKHTFSFTEATKVKLLAVLFVPFEDMPESARRYMTVRAARVFHARFAGGREGVQLSMRDEADAYAQFRADNGRHNRANLLGSNGVTNGVLGRTSAHRIL